MSEPAITVAHLTFPQKATLKELSKLVLPSCLGAQVSVWAVLYSATNSTTNVTPRYVFILQHDAQARAKASSALPANIVSKLSRFLRQNHVNSFIFLLWLRHWQVYLVFNMTCSLCNDVSTF